jgi:hypothetical protein
VADLHPREVPELDRLPDQRECAGDQRLRSDHRGRTREQHERNRPRTARHHSEGVLGRGRVAQQQRPLAEVGEHERGQHQSGPRDADRAGTEVAHVRAERLDARHREHDRPEYEPAAPAVLGEEARGVMGR